MAPSRLKKAAPHPRWGASKAQAKTNQVIRDLKNQIHAMQAERETWLADMKARIAALIDQRDGARRAGQELGEQLAELSVSHDALANTVDDICRERDDAITQRDLVRQEVIKTTAELVAMHQAAPRATASLDIENRLRDEITRLEAKIVQLRANAACRAAEMDMPGLAQLIVQVVKVASGKDGTS